MPRKDTMPASNPRGQPSLLARADLRGQPIEIEIEIGVGVEIEIATDPDHQALTPTA